MSQPWVFNNWKWNDKDVLGSAIYGFNLSGGKVSSSAEVCPGTIYWASVMIEGFSGTGQLGVIWSGAGNTTVATQPKPIDFSGPNPNIEAPFVPPQDARYATVWMYTTQGSTARIKSAWFGPQTGGDIGVDVTKVLRNGEQLRSEAIGINVNYLVDDEEQRKASPNGGPDYITMLKQMKVGSLRYPGGEKSDCYLYAPPPFTGPSQPTLSRISANDWPSNDWNFFDPNYRKWKIAPMTFDQFMAICNTPGLGAMPHMVIAWDSINRPVESGGTYTSFDQLKEHAIGWAKYVAKNYPTQLHCFEFSNESYLGEQHKGAGAKAQDYANNFQWYATSLKPLNPNLRLGANGPNNVYESGQSDPKEVWWWPLVMKQCSKWIDFMSIHAYVIKAWDYSAYEANAINLVFPIQEANAAIETFADADRKGVIRIRVTEVAPIDYGDGSRRVWSWHPATLGHALVLIDQCASTLMQPRVDSTIFWNTRWRSTDTSDPQTMDNSVVNAVYNYKNVLTATGNAWSFLGSFFRDGWPVLSFSSVTVKIWAMKTMTGLRVVLLNKSGKSLDQTVNIAGFQSTPLPTPANNVIYVFTGKHINDPTPAFINPNPPANWTFSFGTGYSGSNQLHITLLPYSATALELLPDIDGSSRM